VEFQCILDSINAVADCNEWTFRRKLRVTGEHEVKERTVLLIRQNQFAAGVIVPLISDRWNPEAFPKLKLTAVAGAR
jgi:hypothetical protein